MGALLRARLQIPARFAYLQSSGEPALHCSRRCWQAASCPHPPFVLSIVQVGSCFSGDCQTEGLEYKVSGEALRKE